MLLNDDEILAFLDTLECILWQTGRDECMYIHRYLGCTMDITMVSIVH